MAESVWFPPEVVVVPRAVFDAWRSRSYSELRAAAEAGEDGLSLDTGRNINRKDEALFRPPRREESLFASDTALLFARCW